MWERKCDRPTRAIHHGKMLLQSAGQLPETSSAHCCTQCKRRAAGASLTTRAGSKQVSRPGACRDRGARLPAASGAAGRASDAPPVARHRAALAAAAPARAAAYRAALASREDVLSPPLPEQLLRVTCRLLEQATRMTTTTTTTTTTTMTTTTRTAQSRSCRLPSAPSWLCVRRPERARPSCSAPLLTSAGRSALCTLSGVGLERTTFFCPAS